MKRLARSYGLLLGLAGLILLGCASKQGAAGDDAKGAPKAKGKPNRLVRETSPYLLLHAHNPVDWYPWGPEAFEKAKKEGKLIFLSVGYSSCYWCHVMERKVFVNEAIAKTLNKHFVCIKVDREERPDVDDVYMTALQVYYQAIGTASGGGWPLSMFMTPEGKPVAGGTYFPPEDTDGATGFPTVLERLIDLWGTKKEQMEGNAEILANETRRVMRPKLSLKPVEANQALVQKSFDAVVASFDPEYGGVDFTPQRTRSPKFPTPAKLLFVQESLKHQPNPEAAKLLDLTLMNMACGGIRDHLGGGFHRYSVDRQWLVPHFEKMLYDQAQLADLYANAFAATKNPLYKQVAEELLGFVERELTSSEGAFFSALDAETNGVEGEFYVWESRDIDKVLGKNSEAFKDAYHVKELSDFEHGNVLRLSVDQLPGPAKDVPLGGTRSGAVMDEFTVSRQKLLDVRNQRQKLLRDEKILAGWNGLMIGAFARAGGTLDQPEFIRIAEKAAQFVLTNMRDQQGRLLHTHTAGVAKLNAYLDDYAFVIDGLLALHSVTNDAKWLTAARKLQDDQLKMFRDEAGGAFFFTSHQHEELLARTKNCYDGVLPAGNSVSARNLTKLAKLTDDKRYREEAQTIVDLFASNLEQSPRGLTVLALAISELLVDSPKKTSDVAVPPKNNAVVQADAVDAPGEVVPTTQKEDAPKKPEHVKAKAFLSVDKLPAGSACQVVVVLEVAKGWHVNANPATEEFQIPTKVTWKSKNGLELVDVKYPKGSGFKFEGSDDEVMVYEGEVQIRGTLKIPKEAGGLTEDMEITINYQACNEKGCLPPKSIKLTGKLPIAKPGEVVKPINPTLFNTKLDPSK